MILLDVTARTTKGAAHDLSKSSRFLCKIGTQSSSFFDVGVHQFILQVSRFAPHQLASPMQCLASHPAHCCLMAFEMLIVLAGIPFPSSQQSLANAAQFPGNLMVLGLAMMNATPIAQSVIGNEFII